MLDVWTTYMEFDAVTRDEFHGGFLAGEYLCGRGHKVVGLDLARELIIKAAARCKGQQWTQSSLSPMPRRFHYERGDSIASSR